MSRDDSLTWILKNVVRPILESALLPDEIKDMRVSLRMSGELDSRRSDKYFRSGMLDESTLPTDFVWVIATNAHTGDGFEWRLGRLSEFDEAEELNASVNNFATIVEQWASESKFAWGQERQAQVPRFDDGMPF